MKKKDILFLCQFFYPEHNSSATLPFDTAKHLASSGFTVDVLSGYPKEYATEKHIPLKENFEGLSIRRLKYLQLSRVGKLGRIINYFSFTLAVLLRVFRLKQYKAVFVYSNPPILPVVPLIAEKLFKTKIVFVAYDLYPEVAYASHSLNEGDIIDKVMTRINRSLFPRVSAVVALTDEMKQFIATQREIDKTRIAVIPNWAHENERNPLPEDFVQFGYRKGQLIVSYFGNMGTCQDVETMLDAMELLRDEKDIQFLIVGHGNKKNYVEERTAGFENVKVFDFLTGEAFEKATAITDIGIVSLEKGLKGMCAPSKYYSYLQTGCAVISVTEADSYLAQEIATEKIGSAVTHGDSEAMADAIRFYAGNRETLDNAQKNAHQLYDGRYTMPIAMRQYETLAKTVINE